MRIARVQDDRGELPGRELRGVDERVREVFADPDGDGGSGGKRSVFCACRDDACTAVLRLTAAEYDALRGSGLYAVLYGHVDRERDEVVARDDSYLVVRRDEAGGGRVQRARRPGRREEAAACRPRRSAAGSTASATREQRRRPAA